MEQLDISPIDSLERNLLGAILLSDTRQAELLAETFEHFPEGLLSDRARLIVEVIRTIHARGFECDLVILRAELVARGLFERVTDAYIDSLLETSRIGVVVPFADQLRRNHAKAKCARIIAEMQRKNAAGEPSNGELEELALAQSEAAIAPAPPPEPKLVTGAQLEKKDLGPIDWALFPLASKSALTLLHGSPKGGKSVFALYCALSIAKGVWLAGKFEVPKKRSVLYVAYEDNLRRIKDRLIKYNTPLGLGDLPDNLFFYEIPPDLALENPALVGELTRVITKHKIEALFIDTLSYVHHADENKAVEMQPVMASARKLCIAYDLAVWLIHHSRKGGAQGDEANMISKVRGSGVIGAAPDHVLLWGSRIAKDVTHCEFESKDADSGDWHIHYIKENDGKQVVWKVESAIEDENVAEKKRKVLAVVVELCKASPEGVSRKQVSKLTDCASVNIIGNYLEEMCQKDGPLIRHMTRQTWFYYPSGPYVNPPTT